MALHDVSSSYVEGRTCAMAEFGQNRDRKRQPPNVVCRLLADDEGRARSWRSARGTAATRRPWPTKSPRCTSAWPTASNGAMRRVRDAIAVRRTAMARTARRPQSHRASRRIGCHPAKKHTTRTPHGVPLHVQHEQPATETPISALSANYRRLLAFLPGTSDSFQHYARQNDCLGRKLPAAVSNNLAPTATAWATSGAWSVRTSDAALLPAVTTRHDTDWRDFERAIRSFRRYKRRLPRFFRLPNVEPDK